MMQLVLGCPQLQRLSVEDFGSPARRVASGHPIASDERSTPRLLARGGGLVTIRFKMLVCIRHR